MKIQYAIILAAAAVALSVTGEDLAKWVDPFTGTSGSGNCFPGACRPFGMVQASPDTGTKTHCSGYKFEDRTIRGFSQTHLNGTGRPAMGDVSILPVAESKFEVSSREFGVAFDKKSEVAAPIHARFEAAWARQYYYRTSASSLSIP